MNTHDTPKTGPKSRTLKACLSSLAICTAIIASSGLLKLAVSDKEPSSKTAFQTFEPITQSIEQMILRGAR